MTPEILFKLVTEFQTLAGRDLSRFILMFYTELPDSWYEARFRKEVIETIKKDAVMIRNYWYSFFGDEHEPKNAVVS